MHVVRIYICISLKSILFFSMISMAAAERQQVVEERRKSRSPSPARKSHSQTPSESSYSESSSISDTFNENVSEGQWLISKSEGEVADFPIDDGKIHLTLTSNFFVSYS